MKSIKFYKIYLNIVLIIGLILSSVTNIYAHEQRHVDIKKIVQTNTVLTKPAYEFEIEWDNPKWKDDNSGNFQNHKETDGFRIYERNATKFEKKFTQIFKKQKIGRDEEKVIIKADDLKYGSIYEYKITPYHEHRDNKTPNAVIGEADYAKIPPEESALFMSDIRVDLENSIDSLIVKFDNPTYDNENVFTGYNIYYEKGNQGNFSGAPIKLDINSKDLEEITENDEDKLIYKIIDKNIDPGTTWNVKVEPVYKNVEVRNKSFVTVQINKKDKNLSFNTQNDYKDVEVVNIPLNIYENGNSHIRLSWGDLSGIPLDKFEIKLLKGNKESKIDEEIITINEGAVDKITEYIITKPKAKTYYKLVVRFKTGETMYSNVGIYDPNLINITPNQPKIYPEIDNGENPKIKIYWDTFTRPPYTDEESDNSVDGLYFDKNVVYDIYVADSVDTINRPGIPTIFAKIPASDLEVTDIEESKNRVFIKEVDKYISFDKEGNFVEKKIKDNKKYYIKVIATKPIPNGIGLSSRPGEESIYIPPNGNISNPINIAKPPFRIKVDEKGKQMLTPTDATLEWDVSWIEVYNRNDKKWYTNVAIKDDGSLAFGEDVKDIYKIIEFYSKQNEEVARLKFKEAGYKDFNNLKFRIVKLDNPNISYESVFDTVENINMIGGYDKYLENLKLPENRDKWKNINPENVSKNKIEYKLTGLEENKRYIFVLRTYIGEGKDKKVSHPVSILITTPPKDSNISIKPTIPNLKEISKTDTSILVEWKNSIKESTYELAIHEGVIENPSKATLIISSEEIGEIGEEIIGDDGVPHIRYNIKPLFPDTGYYIWIRATISENSSDWSNPIYVRTNTIKKPDIPSGFGLASETSLGIYNTANNTKYKPIDSTNITLEWLRDKEDDLKEPEASKNENAQALLDENLKTTYLALFENLIPNREYFTKIKTVVTVTQKGGKNTKTFSYVVELSSRRDFIDKITLEVPKVDRSADKIVTAESPFGETYKFRTTFPREGEGDYDGDIIEDLYPLPTEDFEIQYDSTTKTLTYRFRSDYKDLYGNNDNFVDQRFITNLINKKVFDFNIDLTHYNGYEIKNRKIIIPKSVFDAFESRKITLSITTGGTMFKIKPGFLNTPEVKSIGKTNINSMIDISIEQNKPTLPFINHNELYGTTPQTIYMSVRNEDISKKMTYLGSDMEVMLKPKSKSLAIENNLSVYRNIEDGNWQMVPSIYNENKGLYVTVSSRLGDYTTIARHINTTNSTNKTNLINLNNKISIKDIDKIDLNADISAVQFNNLMAGVINDRKEITLNTALSTNDYNGLKNTALIANGSVIKRDFALDKLVKLYEMKTGTIYESTDDINTTMFTDIKMANNSYKQNLIKAGELGFFGDNNKANYENLLTVNEMFYIINIILDN